MTKCINRWLIIKPLKVELKTLESGLIDLGMNVELANIESIISNRTPFGVILEIADYWQDGAGEFHPTMMCVGEEVFYNVKRGVKIEEASVLSNFDVKEGEELLCMLYDDIYFVTKENPAGKKKRKQIYENLQTPKIN